MRGEGIWKLYGLKAMGIGSCDGRLHSSRCASWKEQDAAYDGNMGSWICEHEEIAVRYCTCSRAHKWRRCWEAESGGLFKFVHLNAL